MEQENKICQNCKKEFIIEPQDFAFYEKIKVPAPTWCPDCRMMRRLTFRNERTFYKRKCDLCGKDIISVYSKDKPFKVYCPTCWWSDNWNSLDYEMDYDFSKSFFEQFRILNEKVPRCLYNFDNVNSDYCQFAARMKNCYLIFGSWFSENCSYGNTVLESKDSFENSFITKCENSFNLLDSVNCFKVLFGQNCTSCMDSLFIFDCKNCQNCIFCTNLRNKSFHIFNKPITKEEYYNLKAEILGSYQNLQRAIGDFKKFLIENAIFRFMTGEKNLNVSGDFIYNAKNIRDSFYIYDGENESFAVRSVKGQKDTMDIYGVSGGQLAYESTNFDLSYLARFSVNGENNYDVSFLSDCFNTKSSFGCMGLRHKEYCILNKQYTKSEYEELIPRIIEHMNAMPYVDKKGRVYKYGEFFPPELSPFCYNETVAQEYFPLTKEQALAQGYSWKDQEERNISIDIRTEDLPDHIKDVKDDIVAKVIQCANAKVSESGTQKINQFSQCTQAFKIIPQELEFYKKMNLPLPRLCPNCRHYQRLKQRNPLKLWHRKCMCGGKKPDIYQGRASVSSSHTNTIEHFHKDKPCPNEFETSYAPERPEIVYCEECYKREVE